MDMNNFYGKIKFILGGVIMERKQKIILQLIIIFLLNILIIEIVTNFSTQNVTTLSRYGSRGSEVTQIQQKLKSKGIYTGSIDGIYGPKTLAAVKTYQRYVGLTPDGVAGTNTLRMLGVSTSSTGGIGKYTASDLNLLARVISAEARGEPYIGQVAVGAVILNRVGHPSFPNTLAGVIYQPGAFTCLTDGNFNQPISSTAKRAAQDAMNGWDPTGGAIYYYNPAKTSNQWMKSRPVTKTIGSHVFCK
jgi:N-acetylmuramoyl-L-alanine amidase